MSKWGGGGVWSETAWGGFLGGDDKQQGVFCQGIKLWLLVTETSRNRKKKENRGKIDSHQARLLQRKESRWNIYYDVSIKNPHPNSLISINRVFSHK